MTDFYVGQKVVCIAKGDWKVSKAEHLAGGQSIIVPENGKIYTVRNIYIDPLSGEPGIRLNEIINDKISKWENFTLYLEIGWPPHEFRPVKETDISVFKKLLRPIRDKQHENSQS